jgi:23S rRNA pseudouridine1911/1915/1917 synthase
LSVTFVSDPAVFEPSSQSPLHLTVESRAHGWRVDHYVCRLFPNYSRAAFQRAISQGHVLVNGLSVKPSRRLRVNDRIAVHLPEEPDATLLPEDIPLDILYEDDALVVINKQADLVTHPGKANYRGTLAAGLQFHFDRLSNVAGQLRPGIVHRLDRDTTGVILVAKSNQVHHRLSGQFERREVTKEYRAIVRGEPAADADVIDTYLRVHPKVREKMIVCPPEGNARHAVTRFEVLQRFRGFAVVRLLPRTGRTHQLRVHMRHLGCPIVSDRLYAGHSQLTLGDVTAELNRDTAEQTLICRQALHAYRLEFRHPVTDQPIVCEAPLPTDMQRTIEALEQYRSQE